MLDIQADSLGLFFYFTHTVGHAVVSIQHCLTWITPHRVCSSCPSIGNAKTHSGSTLFGQSDVFNGQNCFGLSHHCARGEKAGLQ